MCGYRKGFSTQQALLSLIERWKNTLDQNGYGGAMLVDSAVATSFWGIIRRIKNVVSLIYFIRSKYLGYREKVYK